MNINNRYENLVKKLARNYDISFKKKDIDEFLKTHKKNNKSNNYLSVSELQKRISLLEKNIAKILYENPKLYLLGIEDDLDRYNSKYVVIRYALGVKQISVFTPEIRFTMYRIPAINKNIVIKNNDKLSSFKNINIISEEKNEWLEYLEKDLIMKDFKYFKDYLSKEYAETQNLNKIYLNEIDRLKGLYDQYIINNQLDGIPIDNNNLAYSINFELLQKRKSIKRKLKKSLLINILNVGVIFCNGRIYKNHLELPFIRLKI